MGADNFYVDYSNVRYFCMWDPYNKSWIKEISSLFKVPIELLSEPKPSGTPAGRVSPDAAAKTGLKEGTLLCVGGGDQNCACTGAGAVRPGEMFVSLGTAGASGVCTDVQYRDPEGNVFATCHPCSNKWLFEGYQPTAAGVFRWFRDEIAKFESVEAKKSGVNVYEILSDMVKSVPAGAKGLVFIPHFASAGTPRFNPEARGVLAGLTFAHDRNCLARAFMEGITMDMNDIIRSIKNSGIKVTSVRILGGATNSEVWNQMQADIYGMEISTLEIPDAAVLGAAIIAGAGAGIFNSIEEGTDKMVRIKKEYTPNPLSINFIIFLLLYIFCILFVNILFIR